MKVDLLHNKIIRDTVTDAFSKSFEDGLVPLLLDKYGSSVVAVQMYEDYLVDGFIADGEFYYPLTVVLEDGIKREWIKWSTGYRKFINKVPYAYVGTEPLQFSLVEEVPVGFENKLRGRGVYFEGGVINMQIESASSDKTFLAGKYSQSFIDEMNRQISKRIEDAFSITGLADSTATLSLVFAPGTYMEHVVDGVTYRRLLISAHGCSARDLWIKWKSTKLDAPLTVSDNVTDADVVFELGEDVSQKIREKEYRFLVATSSDRYQAAMGRKNITEWRDLIKRIIKRGEVVRCLASTVKEPKTEELSYKLEELLGGYKAPVEEPKAAPAEDKNSDITALLKNLLGVNEEPEVIEDEPKAADIFDLPIESEIAEEDVTEEAYVAPVFDQLPIENRQTYEAVADAPTIESFVTEEEPKAAPAAPAIDEQELRRQIEAELRAELEAEAREALRLEREELARENERLAAIAREAEEKRIAEAEKLRRELEARELAEARERERIAEAARLAILEQKRMEEERDEEERRLAVEAEQRRMFEEEARREEERRREAERIQRDMSFRTESERVEAIVKEVKQSTEIRPDASVKYVSKNARLIFRRPVDPNITKRIHEIILTTIKYLHKENVYIKIKASVPDSSTVNLHFVKIPESESELVVEIIKVLGGSNIGITKAILE